MSIIVGFLTFLLIVNCAALILLVLVQLPKKDAGAGLAFGGGAADALFGAGSGNALTKITKWAAVVFILLAIILGSMATKLSRGNQSEFERAVEQQQQAPTQQPQMTPPPSQPQPQSSAPAAAPASPVLALPSATNAPMSATTNGK